MPYPASHSCHHPTFPICRLGAHNRTHTGRPLASENENPAPDPCSSPTDVVRTTSLDHQGAPSPICLRSPTRLPPRIARLFVHCSPSSDPRQPWRQVEQPTPHGDFNHLNGVVFTRHRFGDRESLVKGRALARRRHCKALLQCSVQAYPQLKGKEPAARRADTPRPPARISMQLPTAVRMGSAASRGARLAGVMV